MDTNPSNKRGCLLWLGLMLVIGLLLFAAIRPDLWVVNRKAMLYEAALDGDKDQIDFLLSIGADINDLPPYSRSLPVRTAIRGAIERQDPELVKYLIDRGASVNAVVRNPGQYGSPLLLAVKLRNLDMVKLLLQNGANPNLDGNTSSGNSLIMALQEGYEEIATILLEYGADASGTNSGAGLALRFSIDAHRENLIPIVLESAIRGYRNTFSENFPMPSDRVDWDLCGQHLITGGFDSALEYGKTLNDPGLMAFIHYYKHARYGRESTDTPLSRYSRSDTWCLYVIRALLESGVDPDTTAAGNVTFLCQAARSNEFALVELLLEYGADPNFAKPDGTTVLHEVVTKVERPGRVEMLRTLAKHGANVNRKNEDGDTPLHLAVYLGQLDGVEALLKLGADPNLRNIHGHTAYDLAQKQANPQLTEFLRSY